MKEENYRLISLAQSGNKEALETLTLQNQGLIWSAVRKFVGRGTEPEDLFQIGAIGLIKAINKFNTDFEVEFSTYAVPMIMGEIRRFLRDDGIIKVSRNLKETAVRVKMASEKISAEKGRDAGVIEISEMLGIPLSEVTLSLEASQPTESLYKSVSDSDNNPILLIDKIYSNNDGEERLVTGVALREAIKNLPVKEKQILMLRYYKEKTQSEVARIIGVSQVQVSRIEKKVLCTLRQNIS